MYNAGVLHWDITPANDSWDKETYIVSSSNRIALTDALSELVKTNRKDGTIEKGGYPIPFTKMTINSSY